MNPKTLFYAVFRKYSRIGGSMIVGSCGLHRAFRAGKSGALVRMHLLTLLKGLASFNQVCRELKHNANYRRFCRLPQGVNPPTPGMLSKFRNSFRVEDWKQLHIALLKELIPSLEFSGVGIFAVDSSDLPAAVRRAWKKKTMYHRRNASGLYRQDADVAPPKQGSPITLLDIKSTPSA